MLKSMETNDVFKDRFLDGFGVIVEPLRSQVGTKIELTIYLNFETRFLKVRALAPVRARIFKTWRSNLGAKMDQKSIKTWKATSNASWDLVFNRFWFDFRSQIGRQTRPTIRKGTETESKFDRFLKESWNLMFSAKRRQGGPRMHHVA